MILDLYIHVHVLLYCITRSFKFYVKKYVLFFCLNLVLIFIICHAYPDTVLVNLLPCGNLLMNASLSLDGLVYMATGAVHQLLLPAATITGRLCLDNNTCVELHSFLVKTQGKCESFFYCFTKLKTTLWKYISKPTFAVC